jgi:formylglycine-generating enzyme required for sulfatase activity
MHGNVSEWCADTWHDNYIGAPVDGSAWLKDGSFPLTRSGSWVNSPGSGRSAGRYRTDPEGWPGMGFRVVCGVAKT